MPRFLVSVFLLACSATAAFGARATPPAKLNATHAVEVRQFVKHSVVYVGGADAEKTVEGRLYAWAKAGNTYADLVAKTAATFRLQPAVAANLVALILERGGSDRLSPGAKLMGRFIDLARAHPDNRLLLVEAGRTIYDESSCDDYAPFQRLLARRKNADADRVLLYGQVYCLPLLTERTTLAPESSAPYLDLAKLAGDANPLLDIAFDRVALQRLQRETTASPQMLRKLRMLLLARLLEQGRMQQALALLPTQDGKPDDDLLPWLSTDTRRETAAAFLLSGQPARAQWWRRAVDAKPAGAPWNTQGLGPDEPKVVAYENTLLNHWVNPQHADAFDLLVEDFRLFDHDVLNLQWSAVWQRLYNRLAVRAGYPGLVQAAVPYELRPDQRKATLAEAIKKCYGCAPDLIAAINQLARDTIHADVVQQAEQASELPAPIRKQMDAEIAAPLPYWTRHELPEPLRSRRQPAPPISSIKLSLVGTPPARSGKPPSWASRLPAGTLVRYQQRGQLIVAITASQSLDPTGEVSAGGYWVSISKDGGKHFSPPLYTGLRMFEPYVVTPNSKLPIIANGNLQLEVEIRQLDDKSITLPPIGLRIKHRQDNLYLSISLADLARDSDADGLTDIEEWAMLLNPRNPDTDGDGIADGQDMLPQAPSGGVADRDAAPMSAVLQHVLGNALGAIVTTSATGPHPAEAAALGSGETDQYNHLRAAFIEAPAKNFEGIRVAKRGIVLTDAQTAALERARGRFFYMSVPTLVLNHDATQALVVWSNGWTGGTLLLTKKAGKWYAKSLSGWIT